MQLDEKTTTELLDKVKSAIGESQAFIDLKSQVENAANDAMTPEQFKEKMDAFTEENGIAGVKESIEKVGIELKKLQNAGPKTEVKLRDMLVEKEDNLKKLSNGDKTATFTLDNVKSNVTRSSVGSHTLAFRLPDVGQQAFRATVIADLFRQATVGPNNNGTIRYVDQNVVTRNAATRAEAATYPESAITWIERSLPIEKMADTIPVTHEALMDVDFIESEINRLLEINMALLEDSQVYDGDGSTPNLKGVDTSATAFSDSTPKIQDASIYDLINVIQTKISNGKESKYMADSVLMNPTDVLKMFSKKDANNNYVIPPFASPDGSIIAGVRVVPTPVVTADTMLVGDFRQGTYYSSEAFEIEIGFVGDQFKQDLMTIKARKRAALLVRIVDNTAFYNVASIATALTNITG